MATVESVNGPIDVEELGTTLIHEHFRFRDEGAAFQWPHLYDEDDEMEKALADARGVMSHGVKTVVDPNAMTGSRDARFSKRIADETGVQIVLATGVYTYEHLPQVLQNRDEDQIAEIFVHDIEQGMQGTEIKAAFLKTACDEPGMVPGVEKLHRAAARASNRTGVPIMAHSRPASGTGPEQVRVFEDEGVDLNKVQIAHTGDTDDLDYIEKLLDKGVWVGMDRYGLDLFLPTDKRNATVLALLERGYVDRMFLSQDYCSTLDWFPPEVQEALRASEVPEWSMTMLFESVIPYLKENGMTDEQLETMLVENPRRWFSA
jgi:phosphotriesterase-related protein